MYREIRRIALMMVVIMVVTGCSNSVKTPDKDIDTADQETNKVRIMSEKNEEEEIAEESTKDQVEEVVETIDGDEEAPEEVEATINEDPSEAEIALMNTLYTGFFSSDTLGFESEEANAFIEIRGQALEVFTEQSFEVSEYCYEMYLDQYSIMENKFKWYIDNLPGDQEALKPLIEEIMRQMYGYKATIEGVFSELEVYADKESETDGTTKDILRRKIFERSMFLYDVTEEYYEWMLVTRDYLYSVIEPINSGTAESLITSTNEVFAGGIADQYVSMAAQYMKLGDMYAYIDSADYLWQATLLDAARSTLNDIEQSEEVILLNELIEAGLQNNNPPVYFVELEGEVSDKVKKSPFTLNVYADSTSVNGPLKGLDILKRLSTMMTSGGLNTEIYEEKVDGLTKDLPFGEDSNKPQINPNHNGSVESYSNVIKDKVKNVPSAMEKIENKTQVEGRSLKDTSKGLKNLALSQKARNEAIENLKKGQDGLKGWLASNFSVDTKYTLIIVALANMLETKKDLLGNEISIK